MLNGDNYWAIRQEVQEKSPNKTNIFFSDWGILEQGVPQKINSRASIIHNIYKNDLSLRISSISEPIVFADGTSVIISSRHFTDFCSDQI